MQGDFSILVSFTLQNTGARDGAEVVQVYLSAPHAPALPPAPPQQLRGFQKVPLVAGASQLVTVTLDARASQRWNAQAHAWVRVPGDYVVRIGASSRDIRLMHKFIL